MKNFGKIIDNFDAVTKQYVDDKDVLKLDKAGGSITGNLTVGGNLTINGTTTTVDSTTLQVKDKLIEVAHGNTTTLTTPAGLVAPKYDGTNSGALVFDSTGTAYVGDVTLKDGNIDVANSGLQPLATRTGLVGGNLVQYDSSALTLKDSGKKISDLALKTDIPTNYVTTDTTQNNISGRKTFTTTIVKKSTTIDLTTPTTGTQWNYIEFTDKNDDRIGIAGSRFDAGGYAGVYLQARNSQQLWIASSTPDSNGNTVTKTSTPTPPDADNSTQIANTAWVLRNYNNADICYRGVDSNAKYSGYYKVAEATLPNWYRVSSARIFVQDFDSADNGVLNVNVYAGSTTVDGVATASTQAQVGFLEGTNCNGIKGHFFLVVRKQSTTERKPIKVELWYRQTGAYQRISATFLNDIGDSRGGLTASNKWVKFTRTGAQEQSYFDKGVVDLTNGFVPNGKFTTTDIALGGYPITEIYDDSTNNAQFVAGALRIENSQNARSDTPSTTTSREVLFTDKNNAQLAKIQSSIGSNFNAINLILTNKDSATTGVELVYDNNVDVWRFNPVVQSLPMQLGEPNRPWTNAYIKDNIYISQTSGQNAGITWQSASDKTNRGIFRHYDDGTTENFVAQSNGFLFRPLNNNNTKSIKVDPKIGALYPEQNAGATLGKESQRWNDAYIQNSINLFQGSDGTANINVTHTGLTNGTNPTSNVYSGLNFEEKDGKNLSEFRSQVNSAGRVSTDLWTRSFGTDYGNYVGFFASPKAKSADTAGVWHFSPNLDAKHDLGNQNLRWRNGHITNIQGCKVINGGGGNSLIQQNSDTSGADITVGSVSCPLKLQGKSERPTYSQGGSVYADIAFTSDVPTALSELTDDMKVIVNNTDNSNSWAFSGGGNLAGSNSTANSCVAIGAGSQTRYQKSIRIGTALGQTPKDQSVTQIGVNNYTSSGRALYLGAGYTGFTYMNAAGSSWTSASDIRDKTDIQTIDHALDFIKKLKPITYVMNDRERYLIRDENDNPILDSNGKQQYDVEAHKRGDKKKHRRFAGLSAQDTYQAMLDCYNNDTNYAQIVDNNKFDHPDDEYLEQYSMSYERLVPFLIKAIQEQQEQIEKLKSKLGE